MSDSLAGDVEALQDRARWKQAAQMGMAHAVVEALPKGYETQLGRWFKDGQVLSVGQWQKIAPSRAFRRRDTDILILDEPTASMDAEAEAEVFERSLNPSKDKLGGRASLHPGGPAGH